MLAVCCQVQWYVADPAILMNRMGSCIAAGCMDVRVCGFCGGSR